MFKPSTEIFHKDESSSDYAPPSREEIATMLQQVLAENPDVLDSDFNGQRIGEFFKEHTASWCVENFRTAVTQLRLRGRLELNLPPAPPQPVVVAPAEPPEEPLPPVPKYMEHIKIKADILGLPPNKYKEHLFGKYREQFRARVEEILRRAALAGG